MKDVLRPYVPEYKGQVASEDGERKFLKFMYENAQYFYSFRLKARHSTTLLFNNMTIFCMGYYP